LWCVLAVGSVQAAVSPDERLADPALEARARELARGLRCLVCQNQSIDDSNAPLAQDLRRIVRERLVAGASDREIEAYLVDRYGEFVLLAPPVRAGTLLLWLGPFTLLLVAGSVLLWLGWQRRRRRGAVPATEAPLNESEARELDALLGRDPTS
jgi:cytochrome c-type biogenesis protein CcmH